LLGIIKIKTMEKKLFLNNYKGFKEQFITLTDVNFLVGENSTGKTSLLKMINLLSSNEFWFNLEFNTNEVELGYFDEIISKQAKEKYFQIGIEKPEGDRIDDSDKKSKIKRIKPTSKVLLKFTEKQSVPILSEAKVRIKNFDVLIKITDKQVVYKKKESSNLDFEKWVLDSSFPKNYNRIRIKRNQIPILFLIRYIESEITSDNHEKNFKPSFNQEILYQNLKWIAPIRAKAKRIYEAYKIKFSPEGNHIPLLLREILMDKNETQRKKIIKILEQFGKDSNLFDNIDVKQLGHKDSSPFEIIVKYQNLEIKLPNVGYGVSQSLPLIIEILSSENTFFSIQQPEVHLHPKAQSAFGSFLFNSVKNDNNKFIIETHSDFTINRFRYEMHSEEKDINFKAKILYFQRNINGNTITEIPINKEGSYSEAVPSSYRNFFIDEELKLLEL